MNVFGIHSTVSIKSIPKQFPNTFVTIVAQVVRMQIQHQYITSNSIKLRIRIGTDTCICRPEIYSSRYIVVAKFQTSNLGTQGVAPHLAEHKLEFVQRRFISQQIKQFHKISTRNFNTKPTQIVLCTIYYIIIIKIRVWGLGLRVWGSGLL